MVLSRHNRWWNHHVSVFSMCLLTFTTIFLLFSLGKTDMFIIFDHVWYSLLVNQKQQQHMFHRFIFHYPMEVPPSSIMTPMENSTGRIFSHLIFHGAGIYANIKGVFLDGIHGAPYMAAPFGSVMGYGGLLGRHASSMETGPRASSQRYRRSKWMPSMFRRLASKCLWVFGTYHG